jgi:DNA-binding NtrC family response regulator
MALCAEASVGRVEVEAPPHHAQARVLVAGHDQLLRIQVVSAIRGDGHRVHEVESGLEILEHLGPRPPGVDRIRVLILDISQNPWVGVALLKAVFCEDWAMPVIVVSNESRRVLAAVEALGVNTVIRKPFKVEVLREKVAAILDTDRSRRGAGA